jgi:hypothetical protein
VHGFQSPANTVVGRKIAAARAASIARRDGFVICVLPFINPPLLCRRVAFLGYPPLPLGLESGGTVLHRISNVKGQPPKAVIGETAIEFCAAMDRISGTREVG